jgi:hypothetical protein
MHFQVATNAEIANQYSEEPMTPLRVRNSIANDPKTIIVKTADILKSFRNETSRMCVIDYDEVEIVCSVLGVLAEESPDIGGRLQKIADLHSRMIELKVDDEKISEDGKILSGAILSLGNALHARLKENKLYIAGQLGYFYEDDLGGDLVLSRLPY